MNNQDIIEKRILLTSINTIYLVVWEIITTFAL